ncbi:MAG: sensor histidine kinase [Candidatus Eisenbacteria bacterium]|nr:sensor histidine kinase [Candidatus Eisenbacteria bacterium]
MSTDLLALAFQALFTLVLAGVHFGLWRQQKQRWYATWGIAWMLYAMRLGLISAYLLDPVRNEVWLFLHQALTGITALLLLLAAQQFASNARWRRRYLLVGFAAVAWAAYSVLVMHNMALAGASSVVLLSGVTLTTGTVFWRHNRMFPSSGARMLAAVYMLWGFHHLDYPFLRPLGQGVLYGVFLDIICIVSVTVGTLVLVLGQERRQLEQRTQQLEQLTQLLLRAQEEERRRIARELHDEAGQALTALKIELDLEGRKEASALAARALEQVRNLSELLRPQALDDLGLVTALQALADDFTTRTRIDVKVEAGEDDAWAPDVALVLYRVAQEALTNVARHSGAKRAWVKLTRDESGVQLVVEDDGRGAGANPRPHLGLLGMRERVTSVNGQLQLASAAVGGLRVEARLPHKSAT